MVDGMMEANPEHKVEIAVALYLSTYFDSNDCGKRYYEENRNDPQFICFFECWNQSQQENLISSPENDSFIKKLRTSTRVYHDMCVEAEQGNPKKMRRILQAKKLFCIPWLLVGDILLTSYPDKYDSEEYQNKVKLAPKPRIQNMAVSKERPSTKMAKLNAIFGKNFEEKEN